MQMIPTVPESFCADVEIAPCPVLAKERRKARRQSRASSQVDSWRSRARTPDAGDRKKGRALQSSALRRRGIRCCLRLRGTNRQSEARHDQYLENYRPEKEVRVRVHGNRGIRN